MALVMKNGTITGKTPIQTGLSSIELFVIYRDGINSTRGLLSGAYCKGVGQQYTGASYSQYLTTLAWGYAENVLSISGGTVTWESAGDTALADGQTYTWIAYGEE